MSRSLVEFLAPLKRGATNKLKCLAVLFYYEEFRDTPAMTTSEMRSALVGARMARAKQMNIAQVMSDAGEAVDSSEVDAHGHRKWHLTGTGRRLVKEKLDLHDIDIEVQTDIASLRRLAEKLSDEVVKGFVDEALLCLGVGAYRASIVFLWAGAIRVLQGEAVSAGWPAINAAVSKHDPKATQVSKIEDLAQVKERVMLLALRELAVIDKGQWTVLQAVLDLRNQCAHPTKYKPELHRARSVSEDLLTIAYSRT